MQLGMLIKGSFNINSDGNTNLNCAEQNNCAQIIPIPLVLVQLQINGETLTFSEIFHFFDILTICKPHFFIIYVLQNRVVLSFVMGHLFLILKRNLLKSGLSLPYPIFLIFKLLLFFAIDLFSPNLIFITLLVHIHFLRISFAFGLFLILLMLEIIAQVA